MNCSLTFLGHVLSTAAGVFLALGLIATWEYVRNRISWWQFHRDRRRR